MKSLKIASILLLVSTLFLKFSSMIRDLVIANYFGTSYIVDAYNAAMIIPNAFILFMLTGMKDAFIPSYLRYEKEGKGKSHLTNIVKSTFFICLVISILGSIAAFFYFPASYPNFSKAAIDIGIYTAILYFLSLSLVGVNAVYEGVFDANSQYSFSVFSQTVVVLFTILSTILLQDVMGGYAIALGYLLGTLASFLIKVVYFKPKNLLLWKQKIDREEVKIFYKVFIPVGVTIMVGQINLTVNFFFAGSFGEGVISYLNYAFRLVSIPQAIFGVTVATIIYPLIVKALNDKNEERFKTGIEKGLTFMLMLLVPTLVIMSFYMKDIVQIAYERGAFDATSTLKTTDASYYYFGSVFFYSLQAILAKGFYSLGKGHVIMRIGLLSILLNVIFNLTFTKFLGYQGLALSMSVVGFFYTAIVFVMLNRLINGFHFRYLLKETTKILVASIPVMVAMYILKDIQALNDLHVLGRFTVVCLVGGLVYLISTFIFKVDGIMIVLRKRKR
ncbi:murein biosynthesis integral membrane protein MurJ [Priestia flexa]|uniref:murein biosynthesis integral membrane protein MurJ n=1 Tax=Priestia flexa TaxID=86664 RepID=UPI0013D763A0|nr:murein biosynthesis integral membrane protein MurJ [Priestia flexa]